MYQKILVPLDGSKLAECVLSHLDNVLKGGGEEEVILVRVTEHSSRYEPLPGPTFAPTSQLIHQPTAAPVRQSELPASVSKKQIQADGYLRRIAKQLEKKRKRFNVQTQVLLGNPAEEIASFAERAHADIIVIASHGRSGVGRWAFGSVADKLFRASKIPVLMVKCQPGPAM